MIQICTYADPESATVGLTSSEVLASYPSRAGLILRSLRTNTGQIALSFSSADAELNKGIVLYPGEVFEMEPRSFTSSAVQAISDVAAQTLSIQEM